MEFPYRYFQVQFTKEGTAFQPAEVEALVNGMAAGQNAVSDLLIMCHGWNNNIDDATDLYLGLADLIKAQVDANPGLGKRTYAICGVLWPSKKFEDADLIPSGAAALNDSVTTDKLRQRLDDLRSLHAGLEWPDAGIPRPEFADLKQLMDDVENDPAAQIQAVRLVRQLLPQDAASTDDASRRFFDTSEKVLITNLTRSLNPPQIPAGLGAASLDPFSNGKVSGLGGAAGFRDVLGGIKSGFLHILNYATYYVMKARAGDVGVKGVAPLIAKLRGGRPDLRIHMIGHSFGCRLIAAAIKALPEEEPFRPDTVLLLQAAFSHNGFAMPGVADRGAFRDVVEKKKVRGPIVITHTRNDKAVGLAYPIASRINGVTAASLGDGNDIFGGMGSNGTQTKQTTPEGVPGTLLAVGEQYPFAVGAHPSRPYNLKADEFIKGHSDIRKPEIAYALTEAMAAH